MVFILFLSGLGIGIVINGLADNLPPDELDRRHPPGRPRCHHCGQAHALIYSLALSSLVLRGGRCEHCGAPRRRRAMVVELAVALILPYLWLWAERTGDPLPAVAWSFLAVAVIASFFILIVVIDVEHRLILWSVVWPAAIAVAVLSSLTPGHGVVKTLLGGLAGYGITLAIFLLAELFARLLQRIRGQPLDEVAFGGGDVNLAGIIGLAVGWPGVILALMIAIMAGGVYSLAYIAVQLLRRRYVPYTAFPYGPFLVLGAVTIYLYGKDLAAVWLAAH